MVSWDQEREIGYCRRFGAAGMLGCGCGLQRQREGQCHGL